MRHSVSMSHSQVPLNILFTKLRSSFLFHTPSNYPVSNDIVFFFPAQRVLSFSFLMKMASWAEAQALMHEQSLCSYLLFISLCCLLIKVEEVSISLCPSFPLTPSLPLSISETSVSSLYFLLLSISHTQLTWHTQMGNCGDKTEIPGTQLTSAEFDCSLGSG